MTDYSLTTSVLLLRLSPGTPLVIDLHHVLRVNICNHVDMRQLLLLFE